MISKMDGNPIIDTAYPKPWIEAWYATGLISGSVVDVGCGYGTDSAWLRSKGFDVVAIDIKQERIDEAYRRSDGPFILGNALELSDTYPHEFDTIINGGMLHCLDDRTEYAAAMSAIAKPGARMVLACASPTSGQCMFWAMTEGEVREALGDWEIESLVDEQFDMEGFVPLSFWICSAVNHGRPD